MKALENVPGHKGRVDIHESGKTMTAERLQYHNQRAMAELDMALKASNADAAKAHFRLSSLHLEKTRGEEVAPQSPVRPQSF